MNISVKSILTAEHNNNALTEMPFELFYLCELLDEKLITKELFDRAYNKLSKELNLNKEEMEMEL